MTKVMTMIDAQKAFSRSLAGYKSAEGKTVQAAWAGVSALADVVRVAEAAGMTTKQVWDVAGDLLKGEDKTLVSRWRYAAFGMAAGKTPEASESLKDFAARCGKPEGLSKQGGEGPREKSDTAAKRAAALSSAAKHATSAYERLVVGKASKALLDRCAALMADIEKAAAAEQAAAEAEKATK